MKTKKIEENGIESPFSEFEEQELEADIGIRQGAPTYECVLQDANCLVSIIFKNGKELSFEHWAPPIEFLRIWGKPNKGLVTVNIDGMHYITIDKKEVVVKSVQPIW